MPTNSSPEPGSDLIIPGEDSPYLVLSMPPGELDELITSNLSPGETFSMKDLPRVKVPAGGVTSWEIPTIDGGETSKTIKGVIIRKDSGRAYYATEFDGGNEPPDCASSNMLVGIPNEDSDTPGPGGACAECPFNEFGSARNGVGKACSEYRRLFILPEDGLLPYVIKIPSGSLANAKAFFFALINARLKPGDVEVVLTLEKVKNAGGIDYGRVIFRTGQRLSPEARAQVAAYSALITPSMDKAAADDDAERDATEAAAA